jgi:hypothetical protein
MLDLLSERCEFVGGLAYTLLLRAALTYADVC